MKITERKTYNASASDLWAIIHDPDNLPAWNPKCVTSDSLQNSKTNERFKVTFEMNGKRTEGYGEILEYREDQMIRFRYHYDHSEKPKTADETFELIPKGKKTKVKHTVDLSGTGLPTWATILILLISRFGRKAGTGPLDGIKCLLD